MVYVIAEVGANHQGDVENAKRYIEVFSELGASAIKFQMRDNDYLFDAHSLETPYENANSFGATYGEHRKRLEFSFEDFEVLKGVCVEKNVDFIVTPFDEKSLSRVCELQVDAIKIASFDIGNIPFLREVSKKKLPVIISTGGANPRHIRNSFEELKSIEDLTILHCVSHYPCRPEDLQLWKIGELKKEYPAAKVGLSDHFNGTLSGPVARMFGAEVFEKHVTFNRALPGTDHKFSLEPDGFRKFVRDIGRVDLMSKINGDYALGEEPVFKKLGKSLIASSLIKKGQKISSDQIRGMILKNAGIPVRDSDKVIGAIDLKAFQAGDVLEYSAISSMSD